MKYFHYQPQKDMSIKQWDRSQFELCDIVLSLTDNNILIGSKIYAIFCRHEVLNLMQYFVCDFIKIKQDLGITGDYVKRCGDVYSRTFNPVRNIKTLSYTHNEMQSQAKDVYKNIMSDLREIAGARFNQLKDK